MEKDSLPHSLRLLEALVSLQLWNSGSHFLYGLWPGTAFSSHRLPSFLWQGPLHMPSHKMTAYIFKTRKRERRLSNILAYEHLLAYFYWVVHAYIHIYVCVCIYLYRIDTDNIHMCVYTHRYNYGSDISAPLPYWGLHSV